MSKRPARLAILGCRGIPARYGGFETFAEELATRLVALGHPVTVYCEGGGGGPEPAEHRGVRLEYVRVPRLGPAATLVYDFLALRRASRDHDVVYMLGYGAGVFLGWGRRSANEVWVNMDGLEWRRAKWGRLARAWLRRSERAALRKADRVVFDSQAVCAEVLGAAAGERVSVIEYGAYVEHEFDPGVLEALGLRARRYLLLVARIEPENHVLEIVRAHSRSASGLELLVVGDVKRARRYGQACLAAAAGNVRFLGALHDQPTLFALRHASAAALHGHSVGGTNPALLEAMAAGVPVVAHENPFNREVLGEGGLFFADEDQLVQTLRGVRAWSAEERDRRGAENRLRVSQRYTWERIAQEYSRLLGGPHGPPQEQPARGVACENEPPPPVPSQPNARRIARS